MNNINRITKEELGMSVAFMSSLRSEDPDTKVGCCIMNEEGMIIATGFNGLKSGQLYNNKWSRDEKLFHIIHAEINALSLITRGTAYKIFCTISPCAACCQNIISHGIKEVIFYDEYHRSQDYKNILDCAGVKYKKIKSKFIDQIKESFCSAPEPRE